jgi:hypothetical protein
MENNKKGILGDFVSEYKNILKPGKLWLLRLYIVVLTFLVKFVLVAYIGFSLFNLTSSGSFFGNLILGLAGFYIVFSCIATLFIVQIVSLFLNIHDNIEDVRNKAIDSNFIPSSTSVNEKSSHASSIFLISIIILSLILSYANLNNNNNPKENNDLNSTSEYKKYKKGNEIEGGTIYWLDETEEHGLIVDNYDLGVMSWNEATNLSEKKGDGWFLPSVDQLAKLHENANYVPNLTNSYFWSSTNYDNYKSWAIDFSNGAREGYDKTELMNVRLVKSF